MAAKSEKVQRRPGHRGESGKSGLLELARSLSLVEIGTIVAIFVVLFFIAPPAFLPLLCGLAAGFILFVVAVAMTEQSTV